MAVVLILEDDAADPGALRRSLEEAGHKVVEGSVTDALTGLPNRRRLEEAGAQELARVQRTSGLLCVLVADVDRLEEINATHGHAAGDIVVRAVAVAVANTVRAVDFAARLDGGSFAVIAPMTDCKGAVELAERLRDRVAGSAVAWEGTDLPVTLSVGVAQGTPKTRSFEALLIAAEQSLRRAKAAGRNRVAATIYVAPGETKPSA